MHVTKPPQLAWDLRTLHGKNVRRLMARLNMTLQEVVEASVLDERTVRSIMQGVTRPHARTLHKLAEGLGVDVDELFQDSRQSNQTVFDRTTNPAVTAAIDAQPELFADWTSAEFDDLFSRVAVGGELTEAGVLASAETIGQRRELLGQVSLILESGEADLLREFVEMLYRRVTQVGTASAPAK